MDKHNLDKKLAITGPLPPIMIITKNNGEITFGVIAACDGKYLMLVDETIPLEDINEKRTKFLNAGEITGLLKKWVKPKKKK